MSATIIKPRKYFSLYSIQILDEETSNSKNVSTEENTVFTPGVLRHILQQTILGQSILNSAAIGPLSEKRQLELAQIIAEWHLQNHSKLNERDLKTYSRTITVLFQFEKEVCMHVCPSCYKLIQIPQ